MGEGVRVRSRPAGSSSLDDRASRRPLMVSVARSLSRLSNCPISFFWSAGTVRKSLKSEAIKPFLLRYLMRSSSTSAGVEAVSACISLLRFSMRCFIAEKCVKAERIVWPSGFYRAKIRKIPQISVLSNLVFIYVGCVVALTLVVVNVFGLALCLAAQGYGQ